MLHLLHSIVLAEQHRLHAVVQQKRCLFPQQRRILFQIDRHNAGVDLLCIVTELFLCRFGVFSTQGTGVGAELFGKLLRLEQCLPCRRNPEFLHRLCPALGLRIELRQGVDLVAPQFQTNGGGALHGKDVQNVAAHGELSGAGHALAAHVAAKDELLNQRIPFDLFSAVQHQRVLLQRFRRNGGLKQRLNARNDDTALPLPHRRQGGNACVLVGYRHALHRCQNQFSGWELPRRCLIQHGVDVVAKTACLCLLRRHRKKRRMCAAQRRQQMRLMNLRHACQGDGLNPLFHGIAQLLIGSQSGKGFRKKLHDGSSFSFGYGVLQSLPAQWLKRFIA